VTYQNDPGGPPSQPETRPRPTLPGRVPPPPPADHMSLGDHLEDLRRRIVLALLGIVPIFIAAMVFGQAILALLIGPLREQLRAASQPAALLATGPFETFATYMQIAIVVTVLAGSPWILYQLWKFVAPGLYAHERRFVHILVPLSSTLTVTSALFLYYVILPVVLAFFIGFGSQVGRSGTPTVAVPEGIVLPQYPVLPGDPPDPQPGQVWINTDLMQLRTAVTTRAGEVAAVGAELVAGAGIIQQYRVSEYVRTVLTMGLAFGAGFQTPVVVLVLGWARIVTRAFLAKYRRYAVAVCAILGAVLTPADPVSMVLLAGPLYVLFELGLLLLVVFPPGGRRRRTSDGDAPDSVDPEAGP